MSEKRYIKNTVILFVSMAITKIVGALFKIPLANLLGGTGMGYFSTAYGLYSPIFALTAAGIPTVMMRITARNAAVGNKPQALAVRRYALILFTVIGMLGSAAVIV
ncbi:MAG: polysaccharide biosynthesis protein, partial [Oscillospiraceae bacterium]|nr:polysaccharide biosynthesis protein [Oscillospiraceae bacterium]